MVLFSDVMLLSSTFAAHLSTPPFQETGGFNWTWVPLLVLLVLLALVLIVIMLFERSSKRTDEVVEEPLAPQGSAYPGTAVAASTDAETGGDSGG